MEEASFCRQTVPNYQTTYRNNPQTQYRTLIQLTRQPV